MPGKTLVSQFDPDQTATIHANYHRRELFTLRELPAGIAASDFDYVEPDWSDGDGSSGDTSPRFFCYLGSWYDTHEFERIGAYSSFTELYRWHGVQTDSAFSATLVRYLSGDDDGFVTVGRYHW